MKRLSGLDAAFLYLETPSTPMHTMGVLILEKRSPALSLNAIESLLLDRLHYLPSLAQRVMSIPLNLDHPVLVDDPNFDIRDHVVRVHWDEPGTLEQVDWAVGHLASRPLDRARPLWQVWWFDHLEGGGSALVFKVHHSIIDGVSSAVFMAQLLDTQPCSPMPRTDLREARIDEVPRASTLAAQALIHQTQKSVNAARIALRLARELRNRRSVHSNETETEEQRPARTLLLPPREPFNVHLPKENLVIQNLRPHCGINNKF